MNMLLVVSVCGYFLGIAVVLWIHTKLNLFPASVYSRVPKAEVCSLVFVIWVVVLGLYILQEYLFAAAPHSILQFIAALLLSGLISAILHFAAACLVTSILERLGNSIRSLPTSR